MKDYIFSLSFILLLSIPKFHICYLLVICASHVSFLSCISGEWFSHSVVSNSCDSTDWSPPGSSVHGILQARVLEWVAVSYRGVERIKVVSLVADHPTTAGCWFLCIKSKHGGWLWSLQITACPAVWNKMLLISFSMQYHPESLHSVTLGLFVKSQKHCFKISACLEAFLNNSQATLRAQMVKNLLAMLETQVWSLGWKDPLEKEMATHSSILAWESPWTEEPGGLQSMRSRRVRHNWATNTEYSNHFWN